MLSKEIFSYSFVILKKNVSHLFCFKSVTSHKFSWSPPLFPLLFLYLLPTLLLSIPLVSHILPAFPHSLAPSTGCCWSCWSFCLTSSRQWHRLTVSCWPTCSGSWCSAQARLTKKASSSTSRLTSLPRSRQCCRSDMSNSDRRNITRPLTYVTSIVKSCENFVANVCLTCPLYTHDKKGTIKKY